MKVSPYFQWVVLAPLLLPAVAGAHHSSAPHYDRNTLVDVRGVVTDWKFVNPHAYIYFDVTGSDGKVENWRCESSAATSLQRRGWTDKTFLPGQELTVKGMAARREANVCSLDAVVFPDGTEITRRDDLSQMDLPDGIVTAAPLAHGAGEVVDRPLILANGQPNISGAWVAAPRQRGGGPGGAMGDAMGEAMAMGGGGNRNPEATEAGIAATEAWDYNYDNPALFCKNANIIHGWRHDQHVNEITQSETSVTLTYGYMDDIVRTIQLDVSEHPDDLVPSTAGHSIGHWNGDTLVVDTVGFSENVYNPLGEVMHSDQMRIMEEFRYDPESQTLSRSYTVEDPLYFKATVTGQDSMMISAVPHEPYGCLELSGSNNQRDVSGS